MMMATMVMMMMMMVMTMTMMRMMTMTMMLRKSSQIQRKGLLVRFWRSRGAIIHKTVLDFSKRTIILLNQKIRIIYH